MRTHAGSVLERRSAARAGAALVLGALLAASCGKGGGGLGGGGGDGGGNPPPDTSALLPTIGLTSVAAGEVAAPAPNDGLIQARWDARTPDGSPVAIGLFLSTDEATLFAGPPVRTATGPGSFVISALPEDTRHWLGLALDLSGGQFEPAGARLSVTPGKVWYVDAGASVIGADGSSPAKAFPFLSDATSLASIGASFGTAANVWVRSGSYPNVAISLEPGVHVYGGFDAAFDLAARDPLKVAQRSVLGAQVGAVNIPPVARIAGPNGIGGLNENSSAVLDGFEIDATGAPVAVDVDTFRAALSSLLIHDSSGRGIRLRSVSATSNYDASIVHCSVLRSGAQGIIVEGAFKLQVEGSRLSANTLEGLNLNDLVAPDGKLARLGVRDSIFFGNGAEGLDCDLGVPPQPPPANGASGAYEVTILGSHFESNGWKDPVNPSDGLLIDIEFEAYPNWSADILVRGCTARANRGSGVHLDLDSTSTTFLHRLLCSANGGDGVLIASESAPSLATVSTSVLSGNQGAGVRVTGGATGGNVPVVLAHSILAGNALAGLQSDLVRSAAVSSASWLQPAPWSGAGGVLQRGSVSEDDALAALFQLAPLDYRTVTGFDGSALTLAQAAGLSVGDLVELADDGTKRLISGFSGASGVLLTPSPASHHAPGSLARFPAGGDVLEDWQPAPGSALLGAGMPPPAGPPPDAGVFGAPLAGLAGIEDSPPAALFHVGASLPPTTAPLAKNGPIAVTFRGGVLDSLSIPGNVRVRRPSGQVVTIPPPVLVANALVVQPPGGGWPGNLITLELFAGLETTDSPPVGLATPVALPFVVQ